MMSQWKLSAVVAESNGLLSQMSDAQPANSLQVSAGFLVPLLLSHITKRHKLNRTRDDSPLLALADLLHLCKNTVLLTRKFWEEETHLPMPRKLIQHGLPANS